jgi:parallel beta-helix repeat protein
VLDGSALPRATDPQKSNEALLTVKGGAVSLEHLNISHAPGHAIWIEKANPFRVSQCNLSDIHGHAIRIAGAEQGVIEGCHIDSVDGTGIWATGGERTTLTASKAIIRDNEISGVNRWKGAGGLGNGIYAEGVGLTVQQNTITDSIEQPWTMGIRVSGNDCLVEKNRLRHVSYGDAGALYVGGRDLARRGNIVRFNLVEDCANGIYLDDRASGNTVTGNIILRAKTGIFIGGGQGNTVTKNVVSGSGAFLKMDNRGMSWAKLQHPFKEDYARLQTFLGGPGVKARLFKAYPALMEVTEQNALLPFHNIVTDNFVDAESTAIEYMDMDHILGGQHKGEYEKWNTIAAPRPVNLPKEQPIDLTALGAPGVTTNMLGAHVPSTPPSK